MSLEIDGRAVQTTHVSLAPHGAATTTFAPVTITADNTRAAVRIGNDGLRPTTRFTSCSPRRVRWTSTLVSRATRTSALYLTRALAIGEAPRFALTSRAVDALSDDVLAQTRVIIFDDVSPTDATAARLKRFVENGGGSSSSTVRRPSWPGAAADILPATAAAAIDRSRGAAASVGGLAYGHAVFEPFRAPRSGDFSAARFYGYRNVTTDQGCASAGALRRRFTRRSSSARFGRGRVLLWASTLDLYWNDLALKPVFLPFVHQVVRHLSRLPGPARIRDRRSGDRPHRAGSRRCPAPSAAATGSLVLAPSGKRQDLEGEQSRVLELTESGFYEVREARAGQSDCGCGKQCRADRIGPNRR